MAKSTQLEGILNRATSATPKAAPASAPAEVVQLETAKPAVQAAKAPKPAKTKAVDVPVQEKQKPVQVEIPESIERALKIRAATEGTTTRNLILLGLRKIGFEVPEDELRDRRKRG